MWQKQFRYGISQEYICVLKNSFEELIFTIFPGKGRGNVEDNGLTQHLTFFHFPYFLQNKTEGTQMEFKYNSSSSAGFLSVNCSERMSERGGVREMGKKLVLPYTLQILFYNNFEAGEGMCHLYTSFYTHFSNSYFSFIQFTLVILYFLNKGDHINELIIS